MRGVRWAARGRPLYDGALDGGGAAQRVVCLAHDVHGLGGQRVPSLGSAGMFPHHIPDLSEGRGGTIEQIGRLSQN